MRTTIQADILLPGAKVDARNFLRSGLWELGIIDNTSISVDGAGVVTVVYRVMLDRPFFAGTGTFIFVGASDIYPYE